MDNMLREDAIRFSKQYFSIFLISFIFCFVAFPAWGGASIGPAVAASFALSLLLYPSLFLISWVKRPPLTRWFEGLLHLMTVPVILYFALLALFFVQYTIATLALDALLMTVMIISVTLYLIFQYARFLKKDPDKDE